MENEIRRIKSEKLRELECIQEHKEIHVCKRIWDGVSDVEQIMGDSAR